MVVSICRATSPYNVRLVLPYERAWGYRGEKRKGLASPLSQEIGLRHPVWSLSRPAGECVRSTWGARYEIEGAQSDVVFLAPKLKLSHVFPRDQNLRSDSPHSQVPRWPEHSGIFQYYLRLILIWEIPFGESRSNKTSTISFIFHLISYSSLLVE